MTIQNVINPDTAYGKCNHSNLLAAYLYQHLTNSLLTFLADERREKIYDWLAAPDQRLKHENARSERRDSTGLWFVHGDDFEDWKMRDNSFLWLHGMRTFLRISLR